MLLYMGINLTEEPLCTYFCEIHPGIICISHAFPVYRIDFFTDTFQIIITLFLHVEYCILLLFATRKKKIFFYRVCKERPSAASESWIPRGNSSATFTTCKCSNQVQVGQTEHNHHNTNNIITYPQ